MRFFGLGKGLISKMLLGGFKLVGLGLICARVAAGFAVA